jgi:hypothetical protein
LEVSKAGQTGAGHMKLNNTRIQQWIEDLTDPAFGVKFNSEYACILNDTDGLEGDASLFLVMRYAELKNTMDVFPWYENANPAEGDFCVSETVVTAFTGIPLEDSRDLIWPSALYDADYDTESLTAHQFVQVLQNYLDTGVVDWSIYLESEAE